MRFAESVESSLLQFRDDFRMLGGQILELAGIVLQIEEANGPAGRRVVGNVAFLSCPFAASVYQLPPLRPHINFFVFEVLANNILACRCVFLAFDIRPETLAVLGRERRRIKEVEDRGGDVDQLDKIIDNSPANPLWSSHEHGNAYGRFVPAVLLEAAVFTQTVAVIADVDD
jgi:hypothetical protein